MLVPRSRRVALAAVVLTGVVAAGCGPASAPQTAAPTPAPAASPTAAATAERPTASPTEAATPDPSPSPEAEPEVVLAAGDIAWCGPDEDDTAALLATEPEARVLALGDLAYERGTPEEFQRCYVPTWGAVLDRTFPAPGNHDAATPGLAGYFGVFGDRAGPEPAGYYRFEIGDRWLGVALNSNCTAAAPCAADGEQVAWLRRTLAAYPDRHVLAFWHHPRFSSGDHGSDPRSAAFWEVLHEAGAALVLNGHDHDYERLAPVAPDGTPDPDGVRELVVGTGGAVLRPFRADPLPATEVRTADHHGVLRLELSACGYTWAFLSTDGSTPDRGSQQLC